MDFENINFHITFSKILLTIFSTFLLFRLGVKFSRIDKEFLSYCKNLKVIGRAGVGLDNIDVKYALERGIKVINAGGATARSVAELTIGLIIMLARKAHWGYRRLLDGTWAKKECKGFELAGKTLGIIGVGNIGHIVGEIAYYGFNMRVLGYRRNLDKIKQPIEPVALDELLMKSDIITLHIPLTEETYHFLSKEKLEKMKQGVLIINTSRIEIINLEHLLDALKSGAVGAFAADINQKPSENPLIKELLSLPNVFATPHIGAQTKEAQRRAAEYIAERLIKLLS